MFKALSKLHDGVKGYRTILWNVLTGLAAILPLPLTIAGPKWVPVILIINVAGNILLRFLTKGPIGDKECHK